MIEDDHYAIQGLFRPLERQGFEIIVATSTTEAYERLRDWQQYDAIVVDLILPSSDSSETPPPEVEAWEAELYSGIGLLKWLLYQVHVTCPVVVLSVVDEPLVDLGVNDHLIACRMAKKGLLPSTVEVEIKLVLSKTKKTMEAEG